MLTVKILRILIVGATLLTALVGCKHPSIVGTWIHETDTKLKHEVGFYSDKTYVQTVYKFILEERVVIRGTYLYDGKTLNSKPMTATVENAPTYAEQRKREAQLPETIMDSDVGKVEWISDTSFRFIPDRDPNKAAVFVKKN